MTPLKTFTYVSLGYRKTLGGGGWVGIVVVVCGKICANNKHFQIGTKIGVVVDIDPPIMVICGKICGGWMGGGSKKTKTKHWAARL